MNACIDLSALYRPVPTAAGQMVGVINGRTNPITIPNPNTQASLLVPLGDMYEGIIVSGTGLSVATGACAPYHPDTLCQLLAPQPSCTHLAMP